MSEINSLLSLSMLLGTIVLIFAMRYYSAIQHAKARLASDVAYGRLAAQALASQAETAAALASIGTALADLKSGLATVEKILREVE